MVEEVRKTLSNNDIHYGRKNVVGIIDNVPDSLPRTALESKSQSRRAFEQVHYDVYSKVEASKHSLKPERGFPTILKIAIPVIGAVSLLFFGKSIGKGLKNYFKNFLK